MPLGSCKDLRIIPVGKYTHFPQTDSGITRGATDSIATWDSAL